MSYISAWRVGNDVVVWERTDAGRVTKRKRGIFEFYTERSDGEYKSIYKEPLIKHSFDNWKDMKSSRDMFTQSYIPMFESDIPPEIKILARDYFEVPAPKLQCTFWDIEVDYDPNRGFSSVEDPYAPINAIALHHHWKNETIVIAVPPKGWDENNKLEKLAKDTNSTIHLVKDEKTLLNMFLTAIQDSDVLSGWNSDFFDTPYTAKRIERVLGVSGLKRLSFPDAFAPRFREVELYGQVRQVCDLGGRISWDYMELFKKYEQTERPSYSLQAISDEIMPDLSKLEYEGSLAELYNKDFEHFIRYNTRDAEVLKGFEDKLGYVGVANQLYHDACGQPNSILGVIKLTDLSIVNYAHNTLDLKCPDGVESVSAKIKGAMVLPPKRGFAVHIGSIDIESLYPSAIRTANISPDTLIGQFDGVMDDDDRACHSAWRSVFNGTTELVTLVFNERLGRTGIETHTGEEWREILFERKWGISGFGTVFTQEFQGIIPAILSYWFKQRKHYKRLMSIAKDNVERLKCIANKTPLEISELTQAIQDAAYYDRLQYVYKIKLNATYGATTNAHFRFFDLRLGQSTTGTGRCILDHMGSKVAELLDGTYNISSPSIVYGDTDSIYFKTNVEHMTGVSTEERLLASIKIADHVGQTVNKSFNDFCIKAFCVQPESLNIIKCEREIVAKSGIFVTKKRYVLKVIDSDGRRCNKLKAMGLEMKKTSTPKIIRSFLEDVVNKILDGEETWDQIDNFIVKYRMNIRSDSPLVDIGLPKGIKNVEVYTEKYANEGIKTRLPGHVAAAIHYNECLKTYNDLDNQPIVSGTKIKVFYLTKKYGKFKNIAIPTDSKNMPFWFDDTFTCDRRLHETKLIDKNLSIIFNTIDRVVPTAQTQFNDELLEW